MVVGYVCGVCVSPNSEKVKLAEQNGNKGKLTGARGGEVLPWYGKGTWGCAAGKARVYFFKLSSLAKGVLLAILVHLIWARICFLAILVNFSLIPVRSSFFSNFGPENAENLANFF